MYLLKYRIKTNYLLFLLLYLTQTQLLIRLFDCRIHNAQGKMGILSIFLPPLVAYIYLDSDHADLILDTLNDLIN